MSRFVTARSLDQALGEMAEGARIVAGGTDLMVTLRQDRMAARDLPATLLDVTGVPELCSLDLSAERPFVGAAITFRRLETDPDVKLRYPLLAQAAATVGSVQIRNLATIGGNVANASPAADGVSALTALGARARIASSAGLRSSSLEDLIVAPNRTTLSPGELILGFELDRSTEGAGQVFEKIGRRQAVVIARMNVAVCLDRDLSEPRVVLGACFPSPRRLTQVEAVVASGSPGPDLWRQAGAAASEQFLSICGWRSSAPYKVPASAGLVALALASAWKEVGGAR